MMDLWQLQIFCKVVELKSFSKAGEAIHLSQPTVSSHIKELETHLGTQLVDRLARQAEPTQAGRLLYDHAKHLLALRSQAEAAIAEFLGKIKGHLTIGGSTIPGGYLLPRWIGSFARLHPEVRTTLMVGDTSEILEKIISGTIEVAVVGALSEEAQLDQTPLVEDELRVVVPSDHPWAQRDSLGLNELIKAPFIIRERGSGTLRSIERLLHLNHTSIDTFTIVAEMGSTEAIRQGIKSKVGISILSAIAVADDVRAGVLRTLTIEGIDWVRSFYLTRHKQRTPSPICRAFTEFLQSEAQHL